MKRSPVTSLLAAITLFALLLTIGCGAPASNTNVNSVSNANVTTNRASANTASNTAPEELVSYQGKGQPCDKDLPLSERLTKVDTELKSKINGPDDDEEDQIGVQYGKKYFDFVLKPEPGQNGDDYLDLYIKGRVGTSSKNQDQFKHLQTFIRPFMKKRCVEGVIFLPANATLPTAGATSTLARNDGFMWFACEDPNNPCANGTCDPKCKLGKGDKAAEPATSGNDAKTTNTSNSNASTSSNR